MGQTLCWAPGRQRCIGSRLSSSGPGSGETERSKTGLMSVGKSPSFGGKQRSTLSGLRGSRGQGSVRGLGVQCACPGFGLLQMDPGSPCETSWVPVATSLFRSVHVCSDDINSTDLQRWLRRLSQSLVSKHLEQHPALCRAQSL